MPPLLAVIRGTAEFKIQRSPLNPNQFHLLTHRSPFPLAGGSMGFVMKHYAQLRAAG